MKRYDLGRGLVSIVFCLCVISPLPAAAEKVLSLDQCLKMAQTRNPTVLASMERKIQAEWKKKSAYSDLLPRLNMDYGYTYLTDVKSIDAGFLGVGDISLTVHDNYAMGLYLDQPLFTGYRLIESYNLADLGLKSAVAGEELAGLEITFQTVAAYYNLLMAMKYQEVMAATVTQLKSHYDDSLHFYKNEIIPLNDLLEAEVYLANARQDFRLAVSNTRKATTTLATLIKEPLGDEFTVIDTPNLSPLLVKLDDLLQKALTERPEVKQANYGVASSQKMVTMARSSYFPTIFMRAGHNRYGGDPLVNGDGLSDLQVPYETTVGVYAQWELFSWGQTGQNVNKAEAARREAQHYLVKVMDEIRMEVDDNYTSVLVSYGNIETARKAVEQALENLRMNDVRYKNQIASSTDVIDAQTLLTSTQTKYYQAVYSYNIWLASLARSVGVRSWEQLLPEKVDAKDS